MVKILKYLSVPEEAEGLLGLALAAHFAAFAGSALSFSSKLETKINKGHAIHISRIKYHQLGCKLIAAWQ